ncbi:hypothetical protein EC991_005204 [Linnemannia zychae]|nr:hypothetical protein EC991_005204 [Linnemannia zychae]
MTMNNQPTENSAEHDDTELDFLERSECPHYTEFDYPALENSDLESPGLPESLVSLESLGNLEDSGGSESELKNNSGKYHPTIDAGLLHHPNRCHQASAIDPA